MDNDNLIISSRLTMPVRPVLSRDEATAVGRRILELSESSTVEVWITHQSIGTTRLSRARTSATQDRERVNLGIRTASGGRAYVGLYTNQLDDATLKIIVPYLDDLANARLGANVNLYQGLFDRGPRQYTTVDLWQDATVRALIETRSEKIGEIFSSIAREKLQGSIFIGAVAEARCVVHSDGVVAYSESTDAEINVTCWSSDGRGSGWGGSVSRDWENVDTVSPVRTAIDIAQRSNNLEGLEPGRRVAILGPAAVAQLVNAMGYAFRAGSTRSLQDTPFSKPPDTSRLGERVFDERIVMRSDPQDPEGGYTPFDRDGFPVQAITWIENGILKQLAYDAQGAARAGITAVAEPPGSVRLEGRGNSTTLDEMIASCELGVYVNRFSGVQVLHQKSGLMEGVTRNGCFLVKEGKIVRAVKNFRFIDSPFFMLNSVDYIGVSRRTPLGGTDYSWPQPPIIVPPMQVRDFNFAALADAV